MDLQRLGAAAVIALTGLGLVLIAGRELLLGLSNPVGVLVAVTTLVLGLAFTVVAPVAYRTDVKSQHLFRIAGWNTLGVVATTVVVWLVVSFQSASDTPLTAPVLSGGLVVGVSAFAHVLIGFNDVRRIRAETVARQRQKAAVVTRFIRHDMKHAAQLLLGYASRLGNGDAASDAELLALGEDMEELGSELSQRHDQIKTIDDLLEEDVSRRPVDLEPTIGRHESTWRAEYPDASLEIDLEAGLAALAGAHLETALVELIENAFEHGGDPAAVTVRGRQSDGSVRVSILDAGGGVPDRERALIADDRTESQLEHSSGLGLWLAKWIVERYDGTLSIDSRSDGPGSEVVVELPAVPE